VSFVNRIRLYHGQLSYIFKTTDPNMFLQKSWLRADAFFLYRSFLRHDGLVYEYLRFNHQVPFNLTEPFSTWISGSTSSRYPFLKQYGAPFSQSLSLRSQARLVLYGAYQPRKPARRFRGGRGVRIIGTEAHHRIITHLSALALC